MSNIYQIPRDRIQYRVGNFSEKTGGASFLVYIDARTASEGLDVVLGVNKWGFVWTQIQGQSWAVRGTLSIGDVIREDVGYPQDNNKKDTADWLKDAVSDALKRCAVQFGVGRELYSAPFLYTKDINTYTQSGKVKINPYEPLTEKGKYYIEGLIDRWHKSIYEKNTKS